MSMIQWRKSSYSSSNDPTCVEVAAKTSDAIAIRDSKDPEGDVLLLSRSEWRAFLMRVKGNELGI